VWGVVDERSSLHGDDDVGAKSSLLLSTPKKQPRAMHGERYLHCWETLRRDVASTVYVDHVAAAGATTAIVAVDIGAPLF
jgi:hypothetical protein